MERQRQRDGARRRRRRRMGFPSVREGREDIAILSSDDVIWSDWCVYASKRASERAKEGKIADQIGSGSEGRKESWTRRKKKGY
jgi:hypothetical protein